MKVEKLRKGQEVKEGQYVTKSVNGEFLVITLNSNEIKERTLSGIEVVTTEREEEQQKNFLKFLDDNKEEIFETIEEQIQYTLEAITMAFSTNSNTIEQVMKKICDIGCRIEELIFYLIVIPIIDSAMATYFEEEEAVE